MRKSLLLLLFPLCLVSCGGGTSQDDYDALQAKYNQLEKEANDCKSQLSSCQSELADYKEKCEDLQEQIENQSSSNDIPTRVIERTVIGSNAKQILVIESKAVRRAVIKLLEYLEQHNKHNLNVLNEREAFLYEQGLIIDTVDKMADLIKKTKELSNKKDICQRIINLINASQSSVPLPTRTPYTTTYN